MIFRVGAEPLSNRSVHKVHEDCEMGDGNNPENSAVKGISLQQRKATIYSFCFFT
ncbi:MAG: hypothetical protein U1E78_02030 [Gammaproteobacteria bacterium]